MLIMPNMRPILGSGHRRTSSNNRIDRRCISSDTLGSAGRLVPISLFRLLFFRNQLQLTPPVEFFYEAAAGAPLFLHLDEEFEENSRSEQPLNIFPRSGADALQHLALLA